MSSGFTHEENVLKATCSFESETLFTTVTKNSWEDYMINMFLTIFCVNLLWSSLSDGMTVFSPVSSARYRRSSVSINPSCPSQVGVIISGDIFTVCFSFSIIVSSSSSAARSSLTFLPDRRQTRPQETGEDRNISLLLLSTVGTNHPGSVHESRSEGLDQPDDRKGFHLVLHLIWFMNVNKIINNFPPGITNKPFYQFFRWKRESSLPREYLFSTCFPRRGKQLRN